MITLHPKLLQLNTNTYIRKFNNLQLFFCGLFFLWVLVPNQLFAQCGTTTIVGTGSTVWVAPAGTTSVTVQAWGGGGGGGNGTSSFGGGGGGGGAYASSTITVIPGVPYNVTIGAGGSSAANGGASSFGAGTVVAAGGGAGTLATTEGSATGKGPGGTVAASVGTIRYAGGTGGGAEKNDGGGGGGAGGSGGTGGNGGDGCIDCTAAVGGTWGEGGTVGSGRGGRGGSDSPDSVAVCGFSPGGGGGGAEDESGELGAVGGSGQVILTYTSTACPSGVTIIYSGASQTFMTSASSKTICSGTSVNIPLRSTAGSKFTWIAAANANVTGESTTVQTSATINNTLTNTTSAVQTVTYTVIPVPTCNNTGVAQVLNVTVNPLPTMTSANAATICSGGTVSIPLTATTSTTTATTFTWIAANNANTTGESTTSQPTSTLSNTIVNISASNQTVTYTVTPSTSCGTGTAQVVSVLVKAPPILSSSLTPAAVCSGTPFTYTATSTFASPTFAWSRATVTGISNGASSGTGNVSETLINTTAASVNVTYVYITTSGGCVGNPQNVVVAVKPAPTLSSSLIPPAICSGTTFGYQATSAASGATFVWARATVANITEAGTSGTSNPVSETLTNTTGVAINVTYTYTTTANSCSSVQNVVVSVKGATKLSSSLTPPEICSATTFAYTATSANPAATFAWSRAAVAGISEALNSEADNTVSETLTNTTASSINVTYVFTTTANGCSNSENVVVSVKPTAQLNSSLTGSVCSGSTFGYTATSASSPVMFAWTRAGVAGINAAAAGSGTGNISEVLSITSGTSAINTTYSYTTTLNGCMGATQNLVVTVNPIPILSSTSTPAAICSATTFTYTATSATSGATFSWSRAAVAGITEAASSGTGSVSETLTNTTTTAIDVVYSYITTAASCGSSAQSVTVSVKPLPILNSTLTPAAICSGATFGYTATSATAGPSFAWSRATVTGITEAGNSGSSNPISQVLTNTTSSAIDVTYVYTTTAASCSGASQSVVVSVRPLPQGTFYGNTICNSGGDIAELTFSSTAGTGPFDLAYNDPTPTARTKTGAVTNTPFAAIPNQTVVGTYVYTLTSITDANGCVRNASITTPTATVTVTSGVITADPATPASATSCAGTTTTFAVSATGVMTYSWQVNTTGANGGTYDVTGTWTTINGSETGPTYNGYTSATLVVTNATTSHDGYRYRAYMTPGCGTDNVYSSVAKMTINTLPVLTSSLAPTPATCSGSAIVYTPESGTAGATFAWTRAAVAGITTAAPASGTGAITTHTLTNTTVNPINVTYAYVTTNTVTTCSSVAENVVVTINPAPVLSSTTGTVASTCSPAAFAYTPESESVGATFAWSRNTPAGITSSDPTSGTSSISGQTLTNTTTAAIDVTYTYTTTANSCSGPAENVVVTVKPLPTISSTPAPSAICTALSNFTYTVTSATAGSTFAWTRATVAGITEAGTSGTGNISETLTNTATSYRDVVYVYTATAAGCSGASLNVEVRVWPVPVLSSNLTQSVCSGTSNTYTPLSATSGASFAWARATVTDLTTGTDPNSGAGAATETFTNSTDAPINTIYTYTTTANGCSGPAQNVVLTVNPIPELSSDLTPDAVCSETAIAFGYTPTSAVSGATYSWTRAAIATINANASGSGTGNVSEVLTNSSTAAVNVTYVYTTTANGCSGAAENVVVSVKPRPVLNSASTASICSAATFGYTATSATASPTFVWTRAAVTGISQAAASGTGDISEVLTNTTIASIDLNYLYTTTADGCTSASTNTVTVTVLPAPTMTSAAVATICTGTSLATIPSLTFAANIASNFAWTRANTANIGPAGPTSGSSNPVSEVLTNATADNLSTTYVVTPTTASGCAGTAQNVVVTVTPVPEQANPINANPN